jgi:hypothetical protein
MSAPIILSYSTYTDTSTCLTGSFDDSDSI